MYNKKEKEYYWMDDLAIQRKTLFSNAILVESDDIKRVEELLDSTPALTKSKKGYEKWLLLDAWEGLSEIDSTNRSHIKIPVTGIDVQTYGIRQVLPDVSKKLYEGNTVLVITNVFKSDQTMNAALRGWATSDVLRNKNSTVIVFADDRSIYPSEVWTHMKIIKPPKSTWDERVTIIHNYDLDLHPTDTLKDYELEDAVRLTSGMNIDQLEASIIESRILSGKIDLGVLSESKKEILAKNPVVDLIDRSKYGFEAVGGYDSLKQRLIDSIILPIKNPQMSERFNISPPRGILLFGPPGCFVEGTFVTMSNGTLKRIETFGEKHLQEINKKIRTTSEEGIDEAIQFHIYEDCKCYELITETGRRVVCSYNQPFWTIDNEWIEADKLEIGQKIQVAEKYENTKKEYIKMKPKNLYSKEKMRKERKKEYLLDEDLAAIFGYAFGDGNIHFRHKPKKPYEVDMVINEEEQDIIPKLKKICKDKFRKEPRTRIKKAKDGKYKGRKIQRKQDMTYLEIHSLEMGSLFYFLHKKKKQRTPPEEILESPKSVVSSFLRWYYEADGSCRGKGRGQGKHNNIDLKSSNPKTLEIIQLLLLQYGIKARRYNKSVSIFRAEDIRKFAKEIGFASNKKKTKLAKLLEILPTKRTNKSSKFEKIKSIRSVGNKTVYDMTTKTHEFIANGIKVHNTGKTLLVKSMAKELNMSIIKIQPENIKGKYVGESEKSMRKVFDIADAMSPCVVFLDEIDRLSKRGGGNQNSSNVDRELFSMLLEKLGDENRKWFFAGATNMIDEIDPAMRRTGRIDSVVPIPYPDSKARREIFKIHTQIKRKLPTNGDIDYEYIGNETYMWSGSDIEQLVIRTANHAMKRAIKNNDITTKIEMDDFLKIIKTFNIDVESNKRQQERIKQQALKYTNDKRLKNVFDHAAKPSERGRMSKAREMINGLNGKKENE